MGRRFRGSTDMHRSIARTYLRRYWQSHGPRDSQGRVRRDRKPRGCKRRSPEHLREAHPRLAPPQGLPQEPARVSAQGGGQRRQGYHAIPRIPAADGSRARFTEHRCAGDRLGPRGGYRAYARGDGEDGSENRRDPEPSLQRRVHLP